MSHILNIGLVEVLKTEAAEVMVTFYVQLIVVQPSSFLIFNDLLEHQGVQFIGKVGVCVVDLNSIHFQ